MKTNETGVTKVALVFCKESGRINYNMQTKKCSKCREVKTVESFNKDNTRNDKLSCWCKVCQKNKNKQWYTGDNKNNRIQKSHEYYHTNKDTILPKAKIYAEKHKEHIKRYSKQYGIINREVLLKRALEYKRVRRLTDVDFKLRESLSSRVRAAMKNNAKTGLTLDLLGCTIPELKFHLEKLFTEGMTWENYGIWHIDHIIPCSIYDLSDPIEQKQCFHFTNLQPLWAVDNLKKSDTIYGSKND